MRWLKSVACGPSTCVEGKSHLVLDGKRYAHSGDLPLMTPFVVADLVHGMMPLDRPAKRVPVDSPWETPQAGEWDGKTLADWLDKGMNRHGRRILETYLGAVLVTEATAPSILHVLFYIRSGTDLDTLLDFEGGAQQDRIIGDSQLGANGLAERLGDSLEVATPVTRIINGGDAVRVKSERVIVRQRRGRHGCAGRRRADQVRPSAPACPSGPSRDDAKRHRPQGLSLLRRAVLADRWSQRIRDDANPPCRVQRRRTPPEGAPGVLAAFLWGRAADEARRLRPDGRRELVTGFLVRILGEHASRPSDVHELDWLAEEWTAGCYAGLMPPGAWSRRGPALRDSVDRVHWAGSETSAIRMGYLEGAMRSGERVADKILDGRG